MTQTSFFDKPPQPRRPFDIIANIDGGARGNPGPAAYGVVIRNAHGEVIKEWGEYLAIQTNNVAEYSALLAALDYAVREKYASLKVLSDSELLVKQMLGEYKVKNPALKDLYERARALARRLQQFSIEHVRRERNREADRLLNQVLDSHAQKL
ncbi:MAG TPA: ribonuclease HI family protein [Candidatus Angelobacter sp.]